MDKNANESQQPYHKIVLEDLKVVEKTTLDFLVLNDWTMMNNPHEEAWRRGLAAVDLIVSLIPEGKCVEIVGKTLIEVVEKITNKKITAALTNLISQNKVVQASRYFIAHEAELPPEAKAAFAAFMENPVAREMLHLSADMIAKTHDTLAEANIISNLRVKEFLEKAAKSPLTQTVAAHMALEGGLMQLGNTCIPAVQKICSHIKGLVVEAAEGIAYEANEATKGLAYENAQLPPLHPPPEQERNQHDFEFPGYPSSQLHTHAELLAEQRMRKEEEIAAKNIPAPTLTLMQLRPGESTWEQIPFGSGSLCEIIAVKNDIVIARNRDGTFVNFLQGELEYNGLYPRKEIGKSFYIGNDNSGVARIETPEERRTIQQTNDQAITRERQGYDRGGWGR